MAKLRSVNTHFWRDGYIETLDPSEKLLYLYFLTNGSTDICGIYELSLRDISFDTGFEKDMVLKILDRFKKDSKIWYIEGWIIIKNFIKNQSINPKVVLGITRSLQNVPRKVWGQIVDNSELNCGLKQACDSLSIDYDSLSHLTLLNLTLPNASEIGYDSLPPTPAKKNKNGIVVLHDGTRARRNFGKWVDANDESVAINLSYYPELTKY